MISIVMPVYNTRADWLEQSVLSCLNQTLQAIELIVVDNGSTSEETISFYKRIKNIDKIKLIDCPKIAGKRGVATAINTGIKKASFQYIARMDSDDWMYPERLEKQFSYLYNNPGTWVVGTQMKIIQTQQITKHPLNLTKKTILQHDAGWFINHPTVMMRKELFNKIGLYVEEPEYFPEDYELWTRCIEANIKISNMSECLLNYNQHGQNVSTIDRHPQWVAALNQYKQRLL